MIQWRSTLCTALTLLAVGCGPKDLPGHYWDLQLSTDDDACNTPAVDYSDQLTYRLRIDDATGEVAVAVGPDVFAAGQVNGCTVTYDSIAWNEVRDAGNIQWTLHGEATAQRGDGACGIASDWIGTEVFTVLSSDDTSVSPGCTYTVDVTGSYDGEVDE